MGLSLKSIGRGLKKVGKGLGKAWEKVDDFALPAIGFALGGPGGAALGSAAARGIGDGKFNAKQTALAGVKGYAGGQLASGLGLVGGKGASGLLGSGRGLISGAVAPSASVASGGAAGGGAAASGGGFLGGAGNVLKSVGGYAAKNPELILGAASAFQGARQQAKADELQKRALALAEQPWNETAGLRRQSLDQMMNPETPDLSSIYAGSGNPFSRPLRPQSGFGGFLRSVR